MAKNKRKKEDSSSDESVYTTPINVLNDNVNALRVDLDDLLDAVDYRYLNSAAYQPTQFALRFSAFTSLISSNAEDFSPTPPTHLQMLDKLATGSNWQVNLCHRGLAKTTLFAENVSLYIAIFGSIPGLRNVTGIVFVADSMDNGAKSFRENLEYKYINSPFLREYLPEARFTEKTIVFTNRDGRKTMIKLNGILTGIRGGRIYGRRPQLVILDDLITETVAKSPVGMETLKKQVFDGVRPIIEPGNFKVILNGTPFRKDDLVVEIVESGAWQTNVYPVCEKFPCTREEFSGSWEARFDYDFVNEQYLQSLAVGRLSSFYQEYMLRINSEDERLVSDKDIKWYNRASLLNNIHNFNIYITTDFATSAKQHADFSVISVWAYSNNGDWFWLDGMCERTTMDVTIDKLFMLCSRYKPLNVGIENTGQQGGFISWIRREMLDRNIWFNLASNGSSEGIRPATDKLSRFSLIVPKFKAGKMFFPEELKDTPIMKEAMSQLKLVTSNGIKGKDDFIDTISMLEYLNAFAPSYSVPIESKRGTMSGNDVFFVDSGTSDDEEHSYTISSYIV